MVSPNIHDDHGNLSIQFLNTNILTPLEQDLINLVLKFQDEQKLNLLFWSLEHLAV